MEQPLPKLRLHAGAAANHSTTLTTPPHLARVTAPRPRLDSIAIDLAGPLKLCPDQDNHACSSTASARSLASRSLAASRARALAASASSLECLLAVAELVLRGVGG